MKRKTLVDIIEILFIILCVYAATTKLHDFQKFRVQLGPSPLLTAFAGWFVRVITVGEIGIAIW